jgi:hypothetical protein
MCSNIPASPAYGVYISQLIRYARVSSNYSDFLKRHLHLRNRLLDQGYEKIRLIRSLKKFIFRYQDLDEIYSVTLMYKVVHHLIAVPVYHHPTMAEITPTRHSHAWKYQTIRTNINVYKYSSTSIRLLSNIRKQTSH